MTNITDREAQWQGRLGEPLTDELPHPLGGTYRCFVNAVLVDFPGVGVYTLSEASVANIFTAPLPPLTPPDPPPDPLTTVYGTDTASYQPANLIPLINSLDPRPEHVVVRLYQEIEGPDQSHSIAQIHSARAAGCTCGAYVWIYRDVDGGDSVRDALGVAERAGLVVPRLWLDLEAYTDGSFPTVANVQRAVNACFEAGITPGIYTGRHFWQDSMGNTDQFSDLPLWYAHYGIPPSLVLPTNFGGWSHASGHQFTSDPVDQNLFQYEVTVP